MEVILKQSYASLGKQGDLVKVKNGFGRNYLIPQGIAIVANAINKKIVFENKRQAEYKEFNIKKAALEAIEVLNNKTINVRAKAGQEGQIFGSVTPLQIAKVLKEEGINIDYTLVHLKHPIKTIGAHEATLKFHKGMLYTLKFYVIAK